MKLSLGRQVTNKGKVLFLDVFQLTNKKNGRMKIAAFYNPNQSRIKTMIGPKVPRIVEGAARPKGPPDRGTNMA